MPRRTLGLNPPLQHVYTVCGTVPLEQPVLFMFTVELFRLYSLK